MKRLLLLKSLFLLCALIVGTSAWATDIALTTTAVTIDDFSPVGSSYVKTAADKTIGGYTWNVYQCMNLGKFSGVTYNNLQMKSGVGTITSPTITSSNGFTVTVTYSSSKALTLQIGSETAQTGTTTATNDQAGTGASVTATTTSTSTSFKLSAGGAVAYVSSIVITPTSGSASDPSITVDPNSINAPSEDTDGTIDVTYTNIASINSEVLFYESDGTTPADYSSWLDAEIDGNNDVYYVIGENTGDVRTAYMKVHQKNTEVYSELITITQSAPVVVTLDFTTNDNWGISEKPTKTETATEFTSGGYTITLEGPSGEGYYFDSNNIMLGKNGAKLTLPAFGFNVSKIKVYGTTGGSGTVTFNVFVGDDAVSTSATSSKEDHEFAIAADKQDVGTIYVIKVTNDANMRITKIEIYGNGCEAGLVQSYGWATYIPTANVEYPANTAYVVTDASVSTGLTLDEVTQVPAGTPLLLKGEGAKTAIVLDAAPAAPSKNLLEVSDGSDLSSGEYAYVLAKKDAGACFKQWTGAMSSLNGRVMLVLDEAVASARAMFNLDDDVTAIEAVKAKNVENGQYFNLAGQRVAQPTKGLYIVNGKKVIIK